MTNTTQIRRLQIEHERFVALTRVSSIFTFRSDGNPPTRYRWMYRGRGLVCPQRVEGAPVEFADEHAVEVRLSSGFPVVPPEVRWLTPILHPNVGPSGMASLRDLGMQWHEQMPLDAVCEHVWDVIRLKVYDLERAVDFFARNWIKTQKLIELPADQRSLRDLWRGGINVIPYERKRTASEERRSIPSDILYLGEETPEPRSPSMGPSTTQTPMPPVVLTPGERPRWVLPPNALRRRVTTDADEVMYIGDTDEPPRRRDSTGERPGAT